MSGRNPRQRKLQTDLAYLAICILTVVLAGAGFMDVSGRLYLFPPVLLLAALLNFMNAWSRLHTGRGEESQTASALVLILAGFLLLILAAVGAYVTWQIFRARG